MLKRAEQSRLLAGLLAIAVFVSQTSVVFAAFEMFPLDSEQSHCIMMTESQDAEKAAKHDTSKSMDCCKTSDCASNFCMPGFSTSTVLTSPVIFSQSSVYSQILLDTSDLLQNGLNPDSLYRPPRHNA
jgi:hypothetical protein